MLLKHAGRKSVRSVLWVKYIDSWPEWRFGTGTGFCKVLELLLIVVASASGRYAFSFVPKKKYIIWDAQIRNRAAYIRYFQLVKSSSQIGKTSFGEPCLWMKEKTSGCIRKKLPAGPCQYSLMLKDIPALPTSQVYRKIQNAFWKSENCENYRFWQFTRAVLRILFSPQ